MDSDRIAIQDLEPGRFNAFFERCFYALVSHPDIDLDMKKAQKRYPNVRLTRPLEVALRKGRYRAAITLISHKANVHLVDITGCHFAAGASLAFIYMTLAGYRFPSVKDLERKIVVEDDEAEYWKAFTEWLETHRKATQTLLNLCVWQLKKTCPEEFIGSLFDDVVLPADVYDQVGCKRKDQKVTRQDEKVLKKKRIFGTAIFGTHLFVPEA